MGQAKWIWLKNETQKNTWMCFVRDFECDAVPVNAIARIAADSKYWLYVNGSMVVFEGGVKRGQRYDATCYDEVDLSAYLVKGKNRVAALVWYFGKSGFSHVSSGQGGFWFDALIDGVSIGSDTAWKVKKHPAYIAAPADDIGPNFRLPESDIYFDAAKDMESWYAPAFCTDEWENAYVLDAEEAGRLGTLIPRGIPMFRDDGVHEFVNSQSVRGLYVQTDTMVEMKLPHNLQFTPILTLDAPAGKRITIKGEMYHTNAPGEDCLKSVYLTKAGVQEYEALGWLNGEHMRLEVPAGVKILDLRYRETGYDTQQMGCFSCDDEMLNRLWEKCYRTLYICMRDNFMDCPDRERAQWWGDANVQMQMLLYCMDENAAALYENGVECMVSWYEATGKMITVIPSGTVHFELPFQNMAGIWGFMVYYRHTGKLDFIRRVYPMAKAYVLQYAIGEDQRVIHRSGSWDWPDWGTHADLTVMENAWYLMALKACEQMAALLEQSEDAEGFHARQHTIRQGMNSLVTQEGWYYHHTDNGRPDDRANALAVLAGLADVSRHEAIAAVLAQSENASPYMEKYVLDALCEMGRVDDAVKRIKKRYGPMTADEYSTLWELWDRSSSLNHAWSGGPLVTMSRYIAGISVAEPGGRVYRIAPHPGSLNRVECTVPTPCGPLSVKLERRPSGGLMTVWVPVGIEVQIQAPDEANEEKEHAAWNIVFSHM